MFPRLCSGVCTVSRGTIGDVVGCHESAMLLRECLLETQKVAIADGVAFAEDTADQVFADLKCARFIVFFND
jgi:hypothetical protein